MPASALSSRSAGAPGAPRVIVALDLPDFATATAMVDRLDGQADFFKVGLELFTADGPRIVDWLSLRGADVFIDLKGHDIPNTVAGLARSATAQGARLITVHASGGLAMLRAAVDGAGSQVDGGILAVTVLTSMDADALGEAWGRPSPDVAAEVRRLAALAHEAGVHGVVASGEELPTLVPTYGASLRVLVPGVRLSGGATHDQRRVVTPSAAAAAGASYVVVGRAVTAAADPAAAMAAVHADVARGVAEGVTGTV
ncbi:MAG: orotidine-5'-phosphate decarboxylase [Gemmatimonadaceae bacterium]|jgi:orotidine-5'-phosphate decarboxylase|nr:orotidine-5'-phosphate decarboxylase [Gemmatimonadaceae bacterium]